MKHVETARNLTPTEEWLNNVSRGSREVRVKANHRVGFEAVAYRGGACYGSPFGYGASVEEACADLMNSLMTEEEEGERK